MSREKSCSSNGSPTKQRRRRYQQSIGQFRYSEHDVLGEGAYGAVYRAYDESVRDEPKKKQKGSHPTGLPAALQGCRVVALKQMSNAKGEEGLAAATLREIAFLNELSQHTKSQDRRTSVMRSRGYATYDATADTPLPGLTVDRSEAAESGASSVSGRGAADEPYSRGREFIVEMYDVVMDAPTRRVFVALELCEGGDLWHFLRSAPERRLVDRGVYLRWMREVLWGVAYMHSRHISHRDLKPQNIMLQRRKDMDDMDEDDELLLGNAYTLRIADFGLSRVEDIPVKKYVHEAVTLWYRSPDVLLGNTNYRYAADSWSIGCIMVEAACGAAVFRGKDEADQLRRIFARTGGPALSHFPSVFDYPHSDKYRSLLVSLTSQDETQRESWSQLVESEMIKLQRLQPNNTADSLACMRQVAALKARLRNYIAGRGGLGVLGEDGLDLAARLLLHEPGRRLSVMDAVHHPFMGPYRLS